MTEIVLQATEGTEGESTNKSIVLQTYRFVFSPIVIEQLSIFAKVHQYDDCKVFKEEWQQWIEEDEIKSIIDTEVKRIYADGFVGDVMDKMFKSARYYYRKKPNKPKVPQQERKVYEGVPQSILMKMDEHINTQIKEHIIQDKHNNQDDSSQPNKLISKISPATSFDNYCTENQSVILQYIKELNENIDEQLDREFIVETINKLKKTYKNRFYNIRVAHNKK